MLPKAILFDLDGTLLDTIEDIQSATNKALLQEGFPPISYDDTRRRVGWGLRRLVEQSVPPETEDSVVERAYKALVGLYHDNPTEKSRIYDGIPELLDHLSEIGMPMAILSNKTHEITEVVISRLFSRWPFAVVHGAKEGIPKKPDPNSALSIAEELGVSPKEMIFVGDTGVDMQTAREAGMYPVGVLWGFREIEELEDKGALAIIKEPMDLLGVMRQEEKR